MSAVLDPQGREPSSWAPAKPPILSPRGGGIERLRRWHLEQIVRALAPLADSRRELAEQLIDRFGLRLARGGACPCWWFKQRMQPLQHARTWGGRCYLPEGFDHLVWALDDGGRRVLITQPYQSEEVETWSDRFGVTIERIEVAPYSSYVECIVLRADRPIGMAVPR
jgi:hypothetical protein